VTGIDNEAGSKIDRLLMTMSYPHGDQLGCLPTLRGWKEEKFV
jgi:hypothetical protein